MDATSSELPSSSSSSSSPNTSARVYFLRAGGAGTDIRGRAGADICGILQTHTHTVMHGCMHIVLLATFRVNPRVNQLPLHNLTRGFGASFTGLMCFLMSTGRSMLGFIFSPSNTTPERESSVTPFCTGSRRPVPQIMATNSGCKNIVISKKNVVFC